MVSDSTSVFYFFYVSYRLNNGMCIHNRRIYNNGNRMNGKKAKQLRKLIYGDKSYRDRKYMKKGLTLISDQLRLKYKKLKKLFHKWDKNTFLLIKGALELEKWQKGLSSMAGDIASKKD